MNSARIFLFGGLIAFAILLMSLFYVDEREAAIKFRFGEIIESNYEPGLHVKIPLINNVLLFSKQIMTVNNPQELFLTKEKKNLFVDFFIKWRIEDVADYYRATRGEQVLAAQRLLEIVKDGIRAEFANRTVPEVVTAERRELMDAMLAKSRDDARQLGIAVIDVRVKRIEFSDEVSESVFNRMRQERVRVAAELRAEGAENAEQIRADADRQRTVILAEAYRDAEKIRGQGDAISADTYAQAYQKDEEFYRFYRSIKAYKGAFGQGNDVLVLDANNDFFQYLNKSKNN
ncbi:MAG: protease modulator HflC [Gammaproteobacteria bacterium]|jgi:membrane protease subunit HflC|nr:HflC protein [Chromatiales bacterium]MCP4924751.1 protease modulator HflC [Gammaproteobacteria bacterium]MDP7154714.1 protease modulator HflC [Gammaproteobacteria bacterium]MDP7419666.1 protease modulator HflC [Gammaproteobacteria bacterium]MDP7660711.1 protease modulator HflC [Gammaproteobacteria bacterium]